MFISRHEVKYHYPQEAEMEKFLCVMGCTMRPYVKNEERNGGKEVG